MSPPFTVAVTGAAGYIGRRLLAALEQDPAVTRVVAIDVRPLSDAPAKVTFVQRDVTQPVDDLFRKHGVQAVVPLAFVVGATRDTRRARQVNVGGLEQVLRAVRVCGVRHVVYLSSHTVYGPHPDNPIPITEEQPVRPVPGFQYGIDKAACEALLAGFAHEQPEASVAVLRSCVVMGPSAQNFITRALFKQVLVALAGHDPPFQFVHEDDVARLLAWMLHQPVAGTYNVAGEGTVTFHEMGRLAGRRIVPLPGWALGPLTEVTWRLRLQNDSPAAGLAFIRWPIVVSTERLRRETGFTFRYAGREALLSFLRTLRPEPASAGARHS